VPESPDWFVSVDGDDGNDGRTPESAFGTITRAARAARPGDVVLVGPGTYHGSVSTQARGREDGRISFVSAVPLGAKIDATGSFAAWDNRGSHIDIVGFEVTGSDYQGIINYGSHVHITNNWVHHLAVPTCNTPNGGAGINHADYSATDNWTVGNVVNHILAPAGCYGLVHGIYHANQGGRVQNNIVFDATFAGIQTWHAANGVTITNNLIWNSEVGILVGSASGRAENFLVANNILLDNRRGIEESGRRFGDSNRYLNNLVYQNDSDFVMISGVPRETISADPGFMRFDPDGSGDYRLRADSPAIDAGIEEGAPSTDFAGMLRPQLTAVDIGPFEYCRQACDEVPAD